MQPPPTSGCTIGTNAVSVDSSMKCSEPAGVPLTRSHPNWLPICWSFAGTSSPSWSRPSHAGSTGRHVGPIRLGATSAG